MDMYINNNPTKQDMNLVREGLKSHDRSFPLGDVYCEAPDISLVARNDAGSIIGGIITSMKYGVMHLEVLWVTDQSRGQGLGRELVALAEDIGRERGYSASETWSFSFQAPEFYRKIGYSVLGVFKGYPNAITEYVLQKKLNTRRQDLAMGVSLRTERWTIAEDLSPESQKLLREGLRSYVNQHVGRLRKEKPEHVINRTLCDEEGNIIGGISTRTTMATMFIDCLWLNDRFRRKGWGTTLLKEAESTAAKTGCISAQGIAMSFQSPGFFKHNGYSFFTISGAYAQSHQEYCLEKIF